MLDGKIERLYVPANPLDILAQQTVAATALGAIDVEDWFATVRRSAPFASLPRSAFEATLDLLAGRYPSDEFAELRPRIVWDRNAGTIEGRPGSQRLAVTSGGTIPDRGLFGVYIIGTEVEGTGSAGGSGDGKAAGPASTAKGGRRVGELDEEMVYESRVGDVFALGATSWKIEDITHDRVLVSPAFGQPGKLPFWKGDSLGRPVDLGRALGAFVRELSASDVGPATERCKASGLDDFAANNLIQYLAEQKLATEVVPSDTTLVVERFHDELGDWRVVLHSPFGMPVHAPWALAVGPAAAPALRDGRLRDGRRRRHRAAGADDGGRAARRRTVPVRPEELEQIVTAEVGGSALFASRFRECAARALLLPRQTPGKRQPLWQQRQRSAQLLDVARKYPTFPIVLETVRECLQDVYDLPALKDIAASIERRELRILQTTTQQPSPFAKSLLFGYVAQFLYEGDSPLAERRAAALALDSTLLNELLGRVELRELLDAKVIEATELELQRLAPDRRMRGLEGVADLLRLLGPLTPDEVAARLEAEVQPAETRPAPGAEPADAAAGERRRSTACPTRDRSPSKPRRAAPRPQRIWPRCSGPTVRSRSTSAAPSGSPPSRTPPGCAMPSASRCRWACRWRSSNPSRTRWATSFRATPGPTGPLPPPRPPPGWDSASPSSARRSSGWPRTAAPSRASSGPTPRHRKAAAAGETATRLTRRSRRPFRRPFCLRRVPANGATPRCSASSAAVRWPRCAPRSSPWMRPRTGGSSRPGRTYGHPAPGGSRRCAGWTASSPPSTSSPAFRFRLPPGNRWSWPAASPTTSRPCSTSSWPPARSSGPGPARCPATTAG